MPTFTLDMEEGAKIPVLAEVGQGRSRLVTRTTSTRHGLVEVWGHETLFGSHAGAGAGMSRHHEPTPGPAATAARAFGVSRRQCVEPRHLGRFGRSEVRQSDRALRRLGEPASCRL